MLRATKAAIVLALLLTAGCEMPQDEYVTLLTTADSALSVKQDRLRREFDFSSYARFDYDEATGTFVLSDSGIARIIADAQWVGEVSRRDSVWTWSWDLPYLTPRLTAMASDARRFGRRHGIRELRESGWNALEDHGWEMTSLVAWIAGAEGAYRAPASDSSAYVFLLLNNVRRAPPGQRVETLIRSPRP